MNNFSTKQLTGQLIDCLLVLTRSHRFLTPLNFVSRLPLTSVKELKKTDEIGLVKSAFLIAVSRKICIQIICKQISFHC